MITTLACAVMASGVAAALTPESRETDDTALGIQVVAALSGSVTSLDSAQESPARRSTTRLPIGDAAVYAYRLADLSLRKVVTDPDGLFSFRSLPAGVYKIIAHKSGFMPAVVLVQRATANVLQELQLELAPQLAEADALGDAAQQGASEDFWALRRRIPGDILREIQIADLEADLDQAGDLATELPPTRFSAEMRALTGISSFSDSSSAILSGGEVDVRSTLGSLNVGVQGQFRELDPSSGALATGAMARSQDLMVSVSPVDGQQLQFSTALGQSDLTDSPADFARLGILWSGRVGQGHTEVSAQFIEEQNLYRNSDLFSGAVPLASQEWAVRGTYSMPVGDDYRLESGMSLSERSPRTVDVDQFQAQRVDLYGQAVQQVAPSLKVRYGLSSSLRNGDMRIAPQAGVTVDLDSRWTAEAFARTSVVHQRDYSQRDLRVQQFGSDGTACDAFGADCYQARFTRQASKSNSLSFAVSHRRFGQDTRLFFSDDFFDRLETLFVAEGDQLPELQFAMQRRLSPRILGRFESHLGAGGGGVFPLAQAQYENAVRYLVASFDTTFEATATDLLVAVFSLQQQLQSNSGPALDPVVRNRLQVLVTQSLSGLLGLPNDWDLLLDMQLSRSEALSLAQTDSELTKRIVGGIAVRF